MPRNHNFLLGQGEKLAHQVKVGKASGPKALPYNFDTARGRIVQKLRLAVRSLGALPPDACPGDEAVAVLTMHPRYISKSDFPADFLRAAGLRAVGSKSRVVTPDAWGTERHPIEAVTEDIFVAAPRDAFRALAANVMHWRSSSNEGLELAQVEDLQAPTPSAKLKSIPRDESSTMLEVVLHNAGKPAIVDAFVAFATRRGAEVLLDRRRDVGGLTFIPVKIRSTGALDLAAFSFVRVARGMPILRPFRPSLLRTVTDFDVSLPTRHSTSSPELAAIFDGGIPLRIQPKLQAWATAVDALGVGPADPDFERHGLAVTSSFLFGPLAKGVAPAAPVCRVEHVRVIDQHLHQTFNLDYVDVLDRIVNHLKANPDRYKLVNISLGPDLAVDDDDVTSWTSRLDELFAHGRYVATVAAGNAGESDAASGLNRVQPPADGVNVLSVGAADSRTGQWRRAPYSCVGPGRSPGLIKPDLLAFGGSANEPFGVLLPSGRAGGNMGTSFAAPLALRSGASVLTRLGSAVSPLAVRALLVHKCEPSPTEPKIEVGWGRAESDLDSLITSDDDEAVIVYQGVLPVGLHLRAPVPVPSSGLSGKVAISATLLIAPEVDPGHPSAYTRSGVEVAFRPHKLRFSVYRDRQGRQQVSNHPKTEAFFSKKKLLNAPEYICREGGHKWEPCLHGVISKKAEQLDEPVFDIYFHHRAAGAPVQNVQSIPYCLVIGIRAPAVPDLYARILRAYSGILVPIRPQTTVRVRV